MIFQHPQDGNQVAADRRGHPEIPQADGGGIGNAWQKNKEELAKKKAAEKAKAAEAAKTEVKADTPATVPVSNAIVAPEVKQAETPKAEQKSSVAGTVGSWLLKKALEQATKKKDAPPANTGANDGTNPAAVTGDNPGAVKGPNPGAVAGDNPGAVKGVNPAAVKDKKIPPPKAA